MRLYVLFFLALFTLPVVGQSTMQHFGPPVVHDDSEAPADIRDCCPEGATCNWRVKVVASLINSDGEPFTSVTYVQRDLFQPVAQIIYQAGIAAINSQNFDAYTGVLQMCASDAGVTPTGVLDLGAEIMGQ